MAEALDKRILASELHAARREMSAHAHGVGRGMKVGEKLKQSISRNRAAWFGGAAVVGVLLSKLIPNRQKVVIKEVYVRPEERSTIGAITGNLLKIAGLVAKPMAAAWMKRRANQPS